MQRIIKVLRQGRTDAGGALEINSPGFEHALQTAKVLQQGAAFGRAETRHGLEDGLVESPRASPPVAGNRKSMRFVSQLLDQLQADGLSPGIHGGRSPWAGWALAKGAWGKWMRS